MHRLRERITKVQELWPLLSVTVADQRTTKPKMQYRYSTWDPDQILANETYVAKPNDPQADRDAIYETALRLFQTKISFDNDPLWRVFIFRASSDADNKRLYLSLTFDHVIIDGRGAVNLAKALVAKDISQLPKEDIQLYEKSGLGQEMDEKPPYSFIASIMGRAIVYPRLPALMQRWLGEYPTWPQRISQPTIDTRWRSAILDIPNDVIKKVKRVGPRHGITSLNSTLHTAWVVAVWVLFLQREEARSQAIKDVSIKDLRDAGDPYCVGGHPTMYVWSSGILTHRTRFWALAKSYEIVSTDPRSAEYGLNMMKMLNLSENKPINPEESKFRAPHSLELPAGDKRAHTLREEDSLMKINSLSPYTGLSGIWSNLSYVGLPEGAIDAVIGASGSATAPAFNPVLIGHENGTRVQNAYSDGAAMTEKDVKNVQRLFLNILIDISREEKKDWIVGDFIDTTPIRAKL